MPTKPSVTVPIWASNPTWSAGPDIGDSNKQDCSAVAPEGHIGGATNPTMAFHQNDWQNKCSQWISDWLELGTSADDPDAHIVETDADGRARIQSLLVTGSSTLAGASLQVTSGAGPTLAAAFITPTTSTVQIGGSTNGFLVSGSVEGAVITATGDHMPLRLTPNSSPPTTFSGKDGGIFIGRMTVPSVDDAHAMFVVFENAAHGVPLLLNQALQEFRGVTGPVALSGSPTIIVPSFSWTHRTAPISVGVPVIWELSYTSDLTATDTYDIDIQNNGVTVINGLRQMIQSTSVDHVMLRGSFSTGAVGTGDNYRVIATPYGASGAGLSNIVFTIRTAY